MTKRGGATSTIVLHPRVRQSAARGWSRIRGHCLFTHGSKPIPDKWHSAEYFRERRARLRLESGREPASDIPDYNAVLARGRELTMMMRLPVLEWPHDLFATDGDVLEVATPPAAGRGARTRAADACTCGRPHRNTIPMTTPSDLGHGFNVRYFCTDACKSHFVRQRMKA